ncbi:MAG: helix-turn-helix domain-containing protein, partial [Geminicoccales bacterium]
GISRLIAELRERHRELISEHSTRAGLALLDQLYSHPVVSVNAIVERLDMPYSTANSLVSRFEELGILNEISGRQRNRLFRYDAYVDLFRSD